MMSLFNSFDLEMFQNQFILLSLFFFMGLTNIFFISSMLSSLKMKFFSFLGLFFNSLTSSNFSKSFDYLMISMMIFIMFLNVFSNLPFNFSFTSQMSLVLGLSLLIWLTLMTFSLIFSFKGSLAHFIPEGSPLILSFFLFIIELVSSFIRPITLTVRLVANILAGHLLVILLSNLTLNFYMGMLVLSGLNLAEMLVSLIQSYIFVTLISLYYSEI